MCSGEIGVFVRATRQSVQAGTRNCAQSFHGRTRNCTELDKEAQQEDYPCDKRKSNHFDQTLVLLKLLLRIRDVGLVVGIWRFGKTLIQVEMTQRGCAG